MNRCQKEEAWINGQSQTSAVSLGPFAAESTVLTLTCDF